MFLTYAYGVHQVTAPDYLTAIICSRLPDSDSLQEMIVIYARLFTETSTPTTSVLNIATAISSIIVHTTEIPWLDRDVSTIVFSTKQKYINNLSKCEAKPQVSSSLKV